jgi:hypothetical protein
MLQPKQKNVKGYRKSISLLQQVQSAKITDRSGLGGLRMDNERDEQEITGNDQDVDNITDELYLVPIYFY